MSATIFQIAIDFELTLADQPGSQPVRGSVTANGRDVVVHCDDPDALLDAQLSNNDALRGIAQVLADHDVTITLSGPDGVVAKIGQIHASFAQRLLTGTKHIALGHAVTLRPLLKRWAHSWQSSPKHSLLPPATLFPLVPTFVREPRRQITTTNYAMGAGRPRLIFVVESEFWDGNPPRTFDLLPETTLIGSSSEADLVLAGTNHFHAEIRHNSRDEYVLYPYGLVNTGVDPSTITADWAAGGIILRTGARVQIGKWKMAYFREEYADHGRPFGGRAGGEWTYQKTQPARVP